MIACDYVSDGMLVCVMFLVDQVHVKVDWDCVRRSCQGPPTELRKKGGAVVTRLWTGQPRVKNAG